MLGVRVAPCTCKLRTPCAIDCRPLYFKRMPNIMENQLEQKMKINWKLGFYTKFTWIEHTIHEISLKSQQNSWRHLEFSSVHVVRTKVFSVRFLNKGVMGSLGTSRNPKP